MPFTLQQVRTFLSTHTPSRIDSPSLRRAAVLFAFLERPDGLHILLTKRTEDVEHHKGQISFPGGMMDQGDATLRETALREAEEEIGLRRGWVEVLGETDEYETPSGFIITPVISSLTRVEAWTLNPAEVEEAFFAPVTLFLDPQNEETFQREWKGVMRDVYSYQFGSHRIWGVTAGIIRGFLRGVSSMQGGAG